ncbi:hypothetical protein DL98DRAFT_593625 [Cadophora sp. DSE1049]|nr:hypothetical protein DL98DRAFT_593625 [Cadophora sp. DSE1049]
MDAAGMDDEIEDAEDTTTSMSKKASYLTRRKADGKQWWPDRVDGDVEYQKDDSEDRGPPEKLREHCQAYLEASEEELVGFDGICQLVERVGREMRTMRQKTRLPTQMPETESQQLVIDPNSPTSSRTIPSPITRHEAPQPRGSSVDTELVNRNDPTLLNDNDVKNAVMHAELMAMNNNLEMKLRREKSNLKELQEEVCKLKLRLIKNEALDIQCDEEQLCLYSQDLEKQHQPLTLTTLPRFQLVDAMILADIFPNNVSEPKGRSLARRMQVICHGLHRSNDAQSTDEMRDVVEANLPWVNASLSRLVTEGAGGRHALVSRLIWFLMKAMQVVQPYDLALPSLFMSVANVTRRTANYVIWTDMKSSVTDGKYGNYLQDWTLVETIAFASAMSLGPPDSSWNHLWLGMQEMERWETPIDALRGRAFSNFTRLLESDPVKEFAHGDELSNVLHEEIRPREDGGHEDMQISKHTAGGSICVRQDEEWCVAV